jgi:dihydroorotate dehydrogenase (NAD+) catalytic subunit
MTAKPSVPASMQRCALLAIALFYDPLVCNKINDGISQYLTNNNLSSVNELVGTLELNPVISPCNSK